MKYLLTFSFLTIFFSLKAQNIETIFQSNNNAKIDKQKDFIYLEKNIDTTQLKYIATYKATIGDKKNDISSSFFLIKKMANKIGANCFQLKSVNNDSSNIHDFILDVYYADDTTLKSNIHYYSKNLVYIFCGEKNTNDMYSLKVNNIKTEFKSGTYLVYELKDGQELKLNKGGFTGATVFAKYQTDRISTFFTITGLGLGGAMPPPGTIGVSFNTGRINYVDTNLGFLLIHLLKQAN